MADEIELAELDRLLRQELSVEPSADFLPRVRARLDRDREGAALTGARAWIGWARLAGWPLAAGLAMLVVAAGSVLLLRQDPLEPVQPTRVTTTEAPPVATGRPRPPDPVPPEPRSVTERPLTTRARWSGVPRTPSAVPAAEVIVDPDQRAAISRVMAMVHEGRLTEASFVVARPLEMPVIEDVTTTPITVDAVVVSPVAFGGVLQKGTDRN